MAKFNTMWVRSLVQVIIGIVAVLLLLMAATPFVAAFMIKRMFPPPSTTHSTFEWPNRLKVQVEQTVSYGRDGTMYDYQFSQDGQIITSAHGYRFPLAFRMGQSQNTSYFLEEKMIAINRRTPPNQSDWVVWGRQGWGSADEITDAERIVDFQERGQKWIITLRTGIAPLPGMEEESGKANQKYVESNDFGKTWKRRTVAKAGKHRAQ